ncbi:MAG: N-acetylmuramoyl-L-alanine amidase, partial [Proteobacteria bacterium]|nr:N-acetylmuramoyl-L-alanine amidase [Pseudomonadota bacterium]
MIETPSPNHDRRPPGRAIEMLVLHYTGMPSADEALARLCD